MKRHFEGRGRVFSTAAAAVLLLAGILILFKGVWPASAGSFPVSSLEPTAADLPAEGRIPGIRGPVLAVAGGEEGSPLYVGTRQGIYRLGAPALHWSRIFAPGIGSGPVRAISLSGTTGSQTLLAGVGSRLWVSDDGGERWRAGLRFPDAILSLAADPSAGSCWLIGTGEGLYLSLDSGRTRRRPAGGGPLGAVFKLLFDPSRPGLCFALGWGGLFRSEDSGKSWSKVPGLFRGQEGETGKDDREDEAADPDAPASDLSGVPGLLFDPGSRALYVSTGRGFFRSADGGLEWEPVPGGWRSFLERVPSPGTIYDLHADRAGRWIWLGAERGLFRVPLAREPWPQAPESRPDPEPSVQQVQRAALAYSEVGPEKIRRWRRLSRWKAFVPSFTLRLDQNQDTNVVSSSSKGVTHFTVGPDDHGRSINFGFTWDLADFIWSSDQTSIDVRSRLNTQLRQDLLEEVTRLYFERERLQAEFEAQPVEEAALRRERALRIEELTAYIDALTGGWFSEQLARS